MMIPSELTINDSTKRFWSAYKHFALRLKERFNVELDYDEYLFSYIINRNLNNKQNTYVKYFIDDKILVYDVSKNYEIPITIYKNEKH